MTNQFSQHVSQILAFSREEAIRLASKCVSPEHLMLGILRQTPKEIFDLFAKKDINPQDFKIKLEQTIRERYIEKAPISNAQEIYLDRNASDILRLAVLEARLQTRNIVEENHLLLAILHAGIDNGAKEYLNEHNITYEEAAGMLREQKEPTTTKRFSSQLDEDEEEFDSSINRSFNSDNNKTSSRGTTTSTRTPNDKTPLLDKFGIDLTKAAAEDKLDPIVGRQDEIQRVTEILCRRKKNNPILIGEPGVGKSAIVEGLAQLIVKRLTSPILFNKRLFNLDLTALVAGTKYRGQFEERIRALIQEIENNPDVIIFIDEIHTLIGAGSSPGTMDAANILKPALARGTMQCIGASTLDEYRNSIEKDGALERRFQKVMVEPTTAEQTVEILKNLKSRYEQHHHVTYQEEAIMACVKLTERYITDRSFPDKAIDALDEVGAKVHLQHVVVPLSIVEKEKEIQFIKDKKMAAVKNQNFELAAGYRDRQVELEAELKQLQDDWVVGDTESRAEVTSSDVANVIARMTGIPVQRMVDTEGERLKNLAAILKGSVIGQENAIEKTVKAIQRNRIGLKDPKRPIGTFMFLGPTGVGKTYLAKKLAEELFGSSDSLIRVDMSEYSESFNTSRLIGAPPGYVGYEEGGQLTERVRRHPYSIVLLDEIEKAHSNIFNLLLQVMDEGRLTDGNGRLIDFRNTIIIMTSNAGTRQLKEFGRGIGFNAGGMGLMINDKDKEHARSIIQKSLSKQFSPEFLNRLDDIITFDQLDLNAIKQIIDIELKDLYKRMNELGYHLEISDAAKEFIANKGYDVQFGARPLKRAIQNYVEDGVCELLLNKELESNNLILVDKKEDEKSLSFVCTKKELAETCE